MKSSEKNTRDRTSLKEDAGDELMKMAGLHCHAIKNKNRNHSIN